MLFRSVGLVALGVGWNFLFVGGTTLVTEAYRPEERAKVQAANDFIMFATLAIASVASGAIEQNFGWTVVNLVPLPLIAVALGGTVWLAMRRRPSIVLVQQ